MGKYKITTGQNLYDIALHIYGSIEGIVDLMMNNTNLSLCDELTAGNELIYTDDYIINSNIVAYNKLHNIVPSNGERTVYFKQSTSSAIGKVLISNNETSVNFTVSGTGTLEINWGDNSVLEKRTLKNEVQTIEHSFDNLISGYRTIRFYGTVQIKYANFTFLKPTTIHLYKPLPVEKFTLHNCSISIDFLPLFEGVYELSLSGIKTADLLPLLANKKLKRLDLSKISMDQPLIDAFLIELVHQYYGRRNCEICMSMLPSGDYQEPERDQNNKYSIKSGMEAIWVLVNEPQWNEAGYWKFLINETLYTAEP